MAEGDEEGTGTTMSEAALVRLERMDGKLTTVIEKLGDLTEAHEAHSAWWSKALSLLMNPSRNFLVLVGMLILGGGLISASEFATALGLGDCECEEEASDGS